MGDLVPGGWPAIDPPRVVECRWFGAVHMVSRALLDSPITWSEARLVVEDRLRSGITRSMREHGYVPIGVPEIEQTDDIVRHVTEWRMKQRAMEDQSPTWVAIREALAEDWAWFANPVDEASGRD